MKKMAVVLACTALVSLIGCGGGGGGGPKVPHYSGAWNGGVSLVNNTCPRQIPEEFVYISFLHNVDQGVSEDGIGNIILDTVVNDGLDTYVGVGEVDANGEGHSFSATGTPHELPGFLSGYRCIESIDFVYSSIDFDTSVAGYVTRHSSITCTKGSAILTCDVTYTGSAYRSAAT